MANISSINGQLSLFQEEQKNDETILAIHSKVERIEPTDWGLLFSGFDEIHIITYSANSKKIEEFLRYFKRAEVIIGSPSQINHGLGELFAMQEVTNNEILGNAYIRDRINSGEFRIYVTSQSHAKLYLLKNSRGDCRVIMSSANCSTQGWDGTQYETYSVYDDPDLYETLIATYEMIREESSSKISVNAKEIKSDGSNLEEHPVIRKIIQTNRAVVIKDVATDEETDFVYRITSRTKEWEKRFRDIKISPDDKGSMMFDIKHAKKLKSAVSKAIEETRRKEFVNPEFVIDYDSRQIVFANETLSLNPPKEKVEGDIHTLVNYINGVENFVGNSARQKRLYWQVINYMFCSPFFARLRHEYASHVPANSVGKYFPMFMILRGPRDAGKSSIVETIQRFMFNTHISSIIRDDFTSKRFTNYFSIKGVPVLVDDITNSQWRYARDIIKNEDALLRSDNKDTHGCFIITTNYAENVDPSISKRMIIFHIGNQLTSNKAAEMDRFLKETKDKTTNSLYCEYLRRILPKVIELIDQINNPEAVGPKWSPDIFRISAETLREIFADYGFDIPDELHEFTRLDYMGDEIKSEKAVEKLINMYQLNPEFFAIDRKKDKMIIDLNQLEPKEMTDFVKTLESELPADTERIHVGNKIIMNLSSIEQYAGMRFKTKGVIQKLFGK